tara:strand:+ start:276 stop:557 length:282 start_codon:yes stop_codon:yes gene_type:complete
MIFRSKKNRQKSLKKSLKNLTTSSVNLNRVRNKNKTTTRNIRNLEKKNKIKGLKKRSTLKGGQVQNIECSNFSTTPIGRQFGCRQPFWSASCM